MSYNDSEGAALSASSPTKPGLPLLSTALDNIRKTRERADTGGSSVPSILVSPSSPLQEHSGSRRGSMMGSSATPSASGSTPTKHHSPSSPRTSPAPAPPPTPPPPAGDSTSFNLSSFLPASLQSLTLSSFIPRLPTANAPTIHLVHSSNEAAEAGGGSGGGPDAGGGQGLQEGDKWGMDLVMEDAHTNGVIYSDSPTSATPSTSSPSKPSFPALARTPSSAAFVAASQEASVNPLTLHAIARRGSEHEALRVIRDREERERMMRDGAQSGEGALEGRPGVLRRKESWTRGMGVLAGVSEVGENGRGTPNGNGSRTPRMTSASLGLVQEGGEDGNKQARRASVASLSEFGQQGANNGSSNGAGADADSTLKGRAKAEGETVRKRSFFSRLGGRKVSTSMRNGDVRDSAMPASPSASRISIEPSSPSVDRTTTKGEKKGDGIKFAKVKAKGKISKDFNKLFLAQELVITPPPLAASPALGAPFAPSASSSAAPSPQTNGDDSHPPVPDDASLHSAQDAEGATSGAKGVGSKGRKKNAVWSIKFSDDGKYLAVGGKDGVVRVWEVLSTREARMATQYPDVAASASAAGTSGDSPTSPSSSLPFSAAPAPHTPISPNPPATPSSAAPPSGRKKATSVGAEAKEKKPPVAAMPVFGAKPLHEYRGHEADVLDLSWSKNNFLLSSSMDKTVRLWHVSRSECLCAFQHLDFVTSIAFHPKDDRFFLSGSLDCKLRLWNIPEKRVHIWTELPELITSVAFTRDGKLAIAGSFVGICMFFEVETFRYHAQFAAKSSRGKNSKGRKVTSMIPFPLPSSGGERLLVTSNDSRMRLYHVSDKNVEAKYAGHENTSSQIRASFSDDGRYIISGSEDRSVYIWDSGMTPKEDGRWHPLKKSKDGPGYETFSLSANIITCASFAPTQTREHLASSGDPIFGDGHLHLQPLAATLSGASLANVETRTTDHLVAVRSSQSTIPLSSGEDAIIVVADDETGIISVWRNSTAPQEGGSSKKNKRLSRASTGA